ncbi:MAG TPA: TrbI/VirB10 family protein [Candidatus Methylacidiphilales bacterium]|nr:TrbI/VirB10 family protein [Candidatus Methylacidiphilales bacterium]
MFNIPGLISLRGRGNGNANTASPKGPPVLPITLYNGDSGDIEISEEYAPYGRLIPCETVITIDSANIETPIIGFVTEDVYHDGRLIIPAGAEVHGQAQVDRSRERIASEDNWYIVWRTTDRMDGAELPLHGVALDMERDYRSGTWALTDGSAGLRGNILKTDNWAEIKLFAATFLSAAASGLQQTQEIINPLSGQSQQTPLSTPQNAGLQGASAVLNQYAEQIADSIKRDGFYVRVPAGKQFYLYVMQTIDLQKARQGESTLNSDKPQTKPTPNQL